MIEVGIAFKRLEMARSLNTEGQDPERMAALETHQNELRRAGGMSVNDGVLEYLILNLI